MFNKSFFVISCEFSKFYLNYRTYLNISIYPHAKKLSLFECFMWSHRSYEDGSNLFWLGRLECVLGGNCNSYMFVKVLSPNG